MMVSLDVFIKQGAEDSFSGVGLNRRTSKDFGSLFWGQWDAPILEELNRLLSGQSTEKSANAASLECDYCE